MSIDKSVKKKKMLYSAQKHIYEKSKDMTLHLPARILNVMNITATIGFITKIERRRALCLYTMI